MAAGNIWMEIAKNISRGLKESYRAGEGMTAHLETSRGQGTTRRMAPEAGAIAPLTRASGPLPKGEVKPARGAHPVQQITPEEDAYRRMEDNTGFMGGGGYA